ncbi:hypothetical protein [Pannonibacter phragmitetus]|uniref:Uncharacterized protein n=1 Tax=Pannonibacter phragmitetus TaxID=121719 RepID=A0A0U3P3F7_9HYPH|nr:hypothetical protein [Pannonibacter phragmitetus]ALV27378.1 hypothetical protein APZ00_10185 [Pannonibacter phragmitetus]
MFQRIPKTASLRTIAAGIVLGLLAEALLPTSATVTVVAIALAASVSITAALGWLARADAVAGVLFMAVVIAAGSITAGLAMLAVSLLAATMIAVNEALTDHYAGR